MGCRSYRGSTFQAPSGPTTFAIVRPGGSKVGDMLQAVTPSGGVMMVPVPAGVAEGESFHVQVVQVQIQNPCVAWQY
jgi:hypothetical protein